MSKARMVYVEWEDSHAHAGAWLYADGFDPGCVVCKSVGWLVHESKKTVTLAASVCAETGQFGEAVTIPKRCIVSQVDIRAP